jgi:peptidoglycan L-alanyl-D-glutamate endopeptidase CwlK
MITGSVGQNGRNLYPDVTLVQTLLASKGYKLGFVDGRIGPKTIGAIRAFQSMFMRDPDGVIEPFGPTWRHLSSPAPHPRSPATKLDWGGDSSKWSQEKKVASLHPALRPKVQAIVDALSKRGFQPKIFFGWRSVAVQLEIFKKGHSKVKFSFHCAQHRDGTPNSYAADIIDSRYGWDSKAETSGFWKALGAEAKVQQLYWGGDWSKFHDWAHVQLVPNSKLASVKRESGL